MRTRLVTTAVSVLILFLAVLPARGQQEDRSKTIVDPGLPPAVEIEDVEIVGRPVVGNTFELRVRYTSHVNARGKIAVRVPEAIALSAVLAGQRLMRQALTFQKGQTQTKMFTLRVKETAASIVHVGISVPGAPYGYQKTSTRELYIQSAKTSFDVFKQGEGGPLLFGLRKQPLQNTSRGALPVGMQVQNTMNYTVSVSGKVEFYSFNNDDFRGVYGAKVEFWFFDEENSSFYHPVSGNQKHVHYDIVDEAGNYSFNFSFTGDMSEFESIILDVSYENDATHIAGLLQGQLFEYPLNPNDPSITFSKDLEVFSDYGAVLRYMMLARELVYERYNGNPPFGFGSIPTYVRDLEGNTIGLFRLYYDASGLDWDREISIDQYRGANISTIMHEYGHWMHERLWDSPYDFTNASDTFTEGWAVFFSFAGRNYANAAYGDALMGYDDNAEEDAFEIAYHANGDPYRFAGMDDAELGHPEQAAFSCALWSLYDGYNAGNFEAAEYAAGDNDDVSGYGRRVFDAVIGMDDDGSLVPQYFSEFEAGLSAHVRQSVQEIRHFMFSDLNSIPNQPMRPAQVANASVTAESGGLKFQWEAQSYPSGRDYGNYPSGYHVYQDGRLIATLPSGTTEYLDSGGYGTQYEITSYSSSGDASGPEIVVIPAPTVYISSGPVHVNEGQQGTWTASISGGSGSYYITWYKQSAPGEPFYGACVATTSCTTSFPDDPNATGDYGAIRISVTDAVWSTHEADERTVVIYEDGDYDGGGGGGGGGGCNGALAAGDSLTTNPPPPPCYAVAGKGAASIRALPQQFALQGNAPNPFSGRTTIRFALPEDAHVELVVYDVMGREVVRLVDRELPAGYHHATLEAGDLSSGVYIYRMTAGDKFTDTRRMVVVK